MSLVQILKQKRKGAGRAYTGLNLDKFNTLERLGRTEFTQNEL